MEDARKLIDEYIEKENELKEMYSDLKCKLLDRLINILLWENENLNAKHDIGCNGVSYYYTLHFEEDYIEFVVESSWAYGGHDVEYHNIPYEKLFYDDWKEKALLNYQKRLEEIKRNKLEQERKEYEKLKEKFDNNKE